MSAAGRALAAPAAAFGGLLLLAGAAAAAPLYIESVAMTGLANPRGLTFGPDGGLYVAEAGRGGGLALPAGDTGTAYLGQSGGISRSLGGVQDRVVADLPSLAAADGSEAIGAHDVAFDSAGDLHVLLGFGADPALRAGLPAEAGLLGHLARVEAGGIVSVADIGGHEQANNPDGGEVNSNPFGLAARQSGGFAVSDSGGNDLLSVAADGTIATEAVLPPRTNPAFPDLGGPVYDAVPTGLALSPEGGSVVGELTGFPFLPGAATIRELVSGSVLGTVASGFTNLIDVAFGPDGVLYALEIDSDGLLGPETTGSLYEVAEDGTRSLLFRGLSAPTGLAVSQDGLFYVSNNGLSPTDGEVLVLASEPAAVPLPAGLPLLAGALGLLAAIRRRRP